MPQMTAFRGLRYNLGRIGSLSDVVAPPYDVIDPALQAELYAKHPQNVVRLILPRACPGDAADARYQRAAQDLKSWQADEILQREGDPALYIYHQRYQWQGRSFERHGFIGRVRLEPFGEGHIYPHEQTHPAAKADRMSLLRACRTNLSPIFGLYPDAENRVQQVLDRAVVGVAGWEATDHLGVEHRLWPITDVNTIGQVTALMCELPLFVADGHHRYETACEYRDSLVRAQGPLSPEHPANFTMVACVSMHDPGLLILPTHRLFRGAAELTVDELIERLGDCFLCETVESTPEAAETVWQRMQYDCDQGLVGLYVKRSDRWVLCQATELAIERMRELEPERTEDWRSLGVSLLHRLIIDDLLGMAGHPKPTYVHETSAVTAALRGEGERSEEESSSEPYGLAALVQPATLEHVRAISLSGQRMPAKSTYFYPKLLSGLVFNPLS